VAHSLARSELEDKVFNGAGWTYGPLVVIALLCTQMPWVMNEMFRSGFFSAVAGMAICAVMVVACVAKAPFPVRAGLLIAVSVLAFATYQVAALYPLLALALVSLPVMWKQLRSQPIPIVTAFVVIILVATRVWPGVIDQLRSRLLLEGSITFLTDSIWIPAALAGALMLLIPGRFRSVGLVVFIVGTGTSGFQVLARQLREADGLFGYGYYGVKFAYIGLFILLITLISALCALVLIVISRFPRRSNDRPSVNFLFRILCSAGFIFLSVSTLRVVAPESRSLYGNSENWIHPTSYGLKLAVSYWDRPKTVFAMIAGPGSGKMINFWHPYFWSGDPWDWAYFQANDDVGVICTFINGADVLAVTTDPVFAIALQQKCDATVEIP